MSTKLRSRTAKEEQGPSILDRLGEELQQREDDGQGTYRIVVDQAPVLSEVALTSGPVGSVNKGAFVEVVEISKDTEQGEVRARIKDPPGWMSIQRQNGSALAVKQEGGGESVVLFCDIRRSGKTSLASRFIDPDKDDKEGPRTTVALDYKFARYAKENSATKMIAHIYDLSGDADGGVGDGTLLSVPISPKTVTTLVLALTVDLSQPQTVFPSLDQWLGVLKERVNAAIKELPKARAESMQSARAASFEQHPDRGSIDPFPVPLFIFANKWDLFVTEVDAEKRKNLCRGMRFISHVHGAHLVFTTIKEKESVKPMRRLLREYLFGDVPKGGQKENVDPSGPICVGAGKDSLQQIGPPTAGVPTLAAWQQAMARDFPDSSALANKGGKKNPEAAQFSEYRESAIDAVVQHRLEELKKHRQQIDRNARLASAGASA
jgi:dynein light intermediate chain 2